MVRVEGVVTEDDSFDNLLEEARKRKEHGHRGVGNFDNLMKGVA